MFSLCVGWLEVCINGEEGKGKRVGWFKCHLKWFDCLLIFSRKVLRAEYFFFSQIKLDSIHFRKKSQIHQKSRTCITLHIQNKVSVFTYSMLTFA